MVPLERTMPLVGCKSWTVVGLPFGRQRVDAFAMMPITPKSWVMQRILQTSKGERPSASTRAVRIYETDLSDAVSTTAVDLCYLDHDCLQLPVVVIDRHVGFSA